MSGTNDNTLIILFYGCEQICPFVLKTKENG